MSDAHTKYFALRVDRVLDCQAQNVVCAHDIAPSAGKRWRTDRAILLASMRELRNFYEALRYRAWLLATSVENQSEPPVVAELATFFDSLDLSEERTNPRRRWQPNPVVPDRTKDFWIVTRNKEEDEPNLDLFLCDEEIAARRFLRECIGRGTDAYGRSCNAAWSFIHQGTKRGALLRAKRTQERDK
ncbi:MAG TPA: hypothetical protein VNT29_06755 [Candidatus Limnocylindrales bacterium]|nr:hypothetical protein [Candidatus Limnocylindrales bacterium]